MDPGLITKYIIRPKKNTYKPLPEFDDKITKGKSYTISSFDILNK